MKSESVKIIAVANEKGGVGKTVMVLNLAAALCQAGRKVLIVDMDPQANATLGFGNSISDPMQSIYGLINGQGDASPDDLILKTEWPNLELIGSHVDLAGAEVELVDVPGRENRLKQALSDIVNRYDYILLDTPPSLSLLTVNVFAFAHEVLVPCQTHPYAYNALAELFDTIHAIQEEINPQLSIRGIVATFFDRRTRVSHRILEKLKSDETYCKFLFNTVIRINTTIADSADAGKPVVFYRPGSAGAADFIHLAEELEAK